MNNSNSSNDEEIWSFTFDELNKHEDWFVRINYLLTMVISVERNYKEIKYDLINKKINQTKLAASCQLSRMTIQKYIANLPQEEYCFLSVIENTITLTRSDIEEIAAATLRLPPKERNGFAKFAIYFMGQLVSYNGVFSHSMIDIATELNSNITTIQAYISHALDLKLIHRLKKGSSFSKKASVYTFE